jgi:uncharacterized Zn finger protein
VKRIWNIYRYRCEQCGIVNEFGSQRDVPSGARIITSQEAQ